MKWSSILSLGISSILGTVAYGADSSSSSGGLPAIEVVGNKFFYSNNGSQFFIKGVAYQSDVTNGTETTFNDPLADADSCKRDVKYLQELGTNTIRVYAVNTSLKHDDCIKTFSDAGIYIIADLSEPGLSINRDDPKWDVLLYNRYTSVIDMFAKYDNVLGFFAGNEVSNAKNNTAASAFVKAAVRDCKSYIKEKKYRNIPIGYSMNDDSDIRVPMAEYFACGDSGESADFIGQNNYEWCGSSSYEKSGWSERTKEFEHLGIPVFFSEYGCNEVQPRKFEEVGTLYSDKMTDVWSGGIVYMYFQEANNYGLVSVSNGEVSTMKDFGYLSKEMASVSPSPAKSDDVKKTTSALTCPATTGTGSVWAAATKLPPTPNEGNCECASSASGCVLADDVSSDDYGKLFGYLCGKMDCGGIQGNGTDGKYGAFSYCKPKDQLNFLLNLYYEKQGKKSDACDFSGSATVNDSPKTDGVCKSVMSQAGSAGTGVVSASATGTYKGGAEAQDTSAAGSGSGGSSGSSTSGSKNGAESVHGDTIKMAGYALGAVAAGIAMMV